MDTKINNLISLLHDLNNLYYYKDGYSIKLSNIYNDSMSVLLDDKIQIPQIINENNDTSLHLAAEYNNLDFFYLCLNKGINPFLYNNKNKTAFQCFNFQSTITNLWKNLQIDFKSFNGIIKHENINVKWENLHDDMKKQIYTNSISYNFVSFNELSQFLNKYNMNSNDMIYQYYKNKTLINLNNDDLLNFALNNDLSPEFNSRILLLSLNIRTDIKKNELSILKLLNKNLALDESYFQTIVNICNSKNPLYKNITLFLVKNLIDKNYDINSQFDTCISVKSKLFLSFKEILDYELIKIKPIYEYVYLSLNTKDHNLKSKKNKL